MHPLAAEWTVPVAGNTYRTAPEPGRLPVDGDEALYWDNAAEHYTVYFRVDRPSLLEIWLDAAGSSEIKLAILGQVYELELTTDTYERYPVCRVQVPEAGYVAVAIKGVRREGGNFGRIRSLIVDSKTTDLELNYVASNDGHMFYWGRRGPSVHLGYELPKGKAIEYVYSELNVPEGMDPIGSYFMANGFSAGYFGVQVRSPTERWVLFSVWSPYHTNNPNALPQEYRVVAGAKGREVVTRNFGGEGSGGQSFMVYPWKAETTYCFLTQARPDGQGNTVFTGWFSEKGGEWQLMASFRRPKTDTWIKGFHSFLENFHTNYGHFERRSLHANQWACDTDGEWHELTRARFTVDGTGNRGHRLDFTGGVKDGYFYMRNGGFIRENTMPGRWFERESSPSRKPRIDFERLPRE
jgi:hypothetical protein